MRPIIWNRSFYLVNKAISRIKHIFGMEDTSEPNLLYKKKKVALLLAYSGINYYGMQINKEFPTIESELIKALVKSSTIPLEHGTDLYKMQFQRAARTDKNVSALGQVCSLKMKVMTDSVEAINVHLPASIRVLDIIKVTQGFNSKVSCSSRSYEYLMPTYGFVPSNLMESISQENYKINEETLYWVRRYFSLYIGTHNFHNFTSRRHFLDKSSIRYIMETKVSEPFMEKGIEFVRLTIRGQSFMLHQIRKMIGLVMAVVRGLAEEDDIFRSWQPEKMSIPRAPGLGLVLREVHYDWYNKKFEGDTSRRSLSFDRYKDVLDAFSQKYIYGPIIDTEIRDKILFEWSVDMLPRHYELDLTRTEALKNCDDSEGDEGDHIPSGSDTCHEIKGDQSVTKIPTHEIILNGSSSPKRLRIKSLGGIDGLDEEGELVKDDNKINQISNVN